jgi:acetate---CoA ligase (ADP-forming)
MAPGEGLEALFSPKSIAIIGASQDVTKFGGRPVQFLREYGYAGAVYPVNPRTAEVQGYRAYASVADLPEAPDLAIVAVAAEAAADAVDACAVRGVRSVVMFSSGFSEMGPEGLALQDRIAATARRTGMRVVGPNCLGAVSIAERAIATFSIVLENSMPPAGPIGIVSQSGNLGSYTMLLAGERNLGVSRFVATGNECDVDVADGIAFMARDPATRVILCIMETCRDPARLTAALAQAHAARKPVVVLKIGETAAGQVAAASHTGALAGSDAVFDAVFQRAGAWRVRSLEGLIDLAQALIALGERRPRGRRVTVLVASGGFGVLMADAASAAGLTLPEPSAATQTRVTAIVPYASPRNPVDATAQMSSRPEILEQILTALLEDAGSDVLILMVASSFYLPRLRSVFMTALKAVRERFPNRVVALCAHGPADAVAELSAMGFVVTDGVSACSNVLAGLVGIAEGLDRPVASPPRAAATAPLPADALRTEAGAKAALAEAGIPVLPERIAADPAGAAREAAALGFPVVLKILSPDLPHKTEVGGVALGLADADAVHEAAAAMLDRVRAAAPAARLEGFLVAPMVSGGTEMIVGTTRDPVFGPVVMAGLGGIFAEILKDVAVRPAPVTEDEALAMLQTLKAFPVLDGARGRAKADLTAAAAAIAAISRFAAAHQDAVDAIDINPLLVRATGEGAVALDALIVPARQAADVAEPVQ